MVRKVRSSIPSRFCWSKYGTESGEGVEDILVRKERERCSNGGIFLWGIGNSVRPGIRLLTRLEAAPIVVFSPMLSKPKDIDVSPSSTILWKYARDLNGQPWPLPNGTTVISRVHSAAGDAKRSHYALVCRSEVPLEISLNHDKINSGALVNLATGTRLGNSQVTSIVKRLPGAKARGAEYSVGFVADLVLPYFVSLHQSPSGDQCDSRIGHGAPVQRSLL